MSPRMLRDQKTVMRVLLVVVFLLVVALIFAISQIESQLRKQQQANDHAVALQHAACLRGNQLKAGLVEISEFQRHVAQGVAQVALTPAMAAYFRKSIRLIDRREQKPAFHRLDCDALYPVDP